MRKIPWEELRERGLALLQKYKYVALVMAVGCALLLWPSGENKDPPRAVASAPPVTAPQEDFSVSALEEKLERTLSKVHGAGDVSVMLTVQGGSRQVLAEDVKNSRSAEGGSESQRATVVVSGTSGTGGGPVLVQQLYPKFQGALVVCSGGEDAGVRLKLMEAVSALTGLGTDKISICKGKG